MAASRVSESGQEAESAASARHAMVDRVGRHFSETAHWTGIDRMSDRLRDALEHVPRERFVPARVRGMAYADTALAIGSGQTISQPFIVALSIEQARVGRRSRVLEVGTGSGYEAAVLSEMGAEVYSIEIVPELFDRASNDLLANGYGGISLRLGDGYMGWPEAAPFDAIIMTACAISVPKPLIVQLANGGRLVAPIGAPCEGQRLETHVKDEDGRVEGGLPVVFVPLTRSPVQPSERVESA